MPKTTHVHKYMRGVLGKNYRILRCMLPGCKHYIAEELGRNRLTICWRCGDTMVLTYEAMQLERPHCEKPECLKVQGYALKYGSKKHKKMETDRLKELLSADDLLKKVMK